MPTIYGGYRKYSGANQNQYCCFAVSRGIYKDYGKITQNKNIMARVSSITITTLRLKMNDIGKTQRWTEDDTLNVHLYWEVVELTPLHR